MSGSKAESWVAWMVKFDQNETNHKKTNHYRSVRSFILEVIDRIQYLFCDFFFFFTGSLMIRQGFMQIGKLFLVFLSQIEVSILTSDT